MSLARAWTRQLYGASGAALLAPGTIALALVILAFAGGFGSIGQALEGPATPGTGSTALAGAGAQAKLRQALAAVGGTTAGTTATGTNVRTGGVGVGSRTAGGPPGTVGNPGTGHHRPPGNPGGNPGGHHNPPPGHPGGNPGGNPPPVTPPAPAPTLVDGLVKATTSITSKLPGPLGTLATNTLNSVGAAVDRILPIRIGSGL